MAGSAYGTARLGRRKDGPGLAGGWTGQGWAGRRKQQEGPLEARVGKDASPGLNAHPVKGGKR